MVIFHSYVSLPEGTCYLGCFWGAPILVLNPHSHIGLPDLTQGPDDAAVPFGPGRAGVQMGAGVKTPQPLIG